MTAATAIRIAVLASLMGCGAGEPPPAPKCPHEGATPAGPSAAATPAPPPPESPKASLPPGWFLSGGARAEFEADADPTVKHGGAAGLRLRPKPTYKSGYGTLMQERPAAPHRGKRMRFRAFAKGESVVGRGDIWLRVQAPDSPGDGPGLGGGRCALASTFDWQPCEIVFDVPERGAQIELGIGLGDRGTLWLDDVTLEQVGDSPAGSQVTGWILSGSATSSFEIGVDATTKHGGKASGWLRSTSPTKGFGTLMQATPATPYVGKRVRLAAFVKTADVAGWAGLWMRVDGASRSSLAFDNMEDRAIHGTTDWKRYEVVLDVAPEATGIAFGLIVHGEGRAWIDDVAIETVDARVPTTGKAASKPQNLDFEK